MQPQEADERRHAARTAQLDALFDKIHDEDSVRALAKLPFDPEVWVKWFNQYAAQHNKPMCKEMRRVVGLQTLNACTRLMYSPIDRRVVELHSRAELTELCQKTKLIDFGPRDRIMPATPGKLKTAFYVYERDCLQLAHDFIAHKLRPLVLNMASERRPGGGWRGGAGAQEENLFRRSTYCIALEDEFNKDHKRKWTYPIPEFGIIYSPGVLVFRGSEAAGYPYLPAPVPMDFIACAAYRGPKLVFNKKEPRFSPNFVSGTERKVLAILQTALDNGHDSLVLSAFGCGAFSNPPRHVAEIFRSALTGPFAGCFRAVGFAILDDANAGKTHNPDGNVKPFMQVFNELSIKSPSLAALLAAAPVASFPAATTSGKHAAVVAPAVGKVPAETQSADTPAKPSVASDSPLDFSAKPAPAADVATVVLHMSTSSVEPTSSPSLEDEEIPAAVDDRDICRFYGAGKCNRGDRCKFRHADVTS